MEKLYTPEAEILDTELSALINKDNFKHKILVVGYNSDEGCSYHFRGDSWQEIALEMKKENIFDNDKLNLKEGSFVTYDSQLCSYKELVLKKSNIKHIKYVIFE